MNKADFVRRISERSELPQSEVKEFLKAFEDTVLEDVFECEDSIRLSFGTLQGVTKTIPGREGVSPLNGKKYKTEDRTVHGYPKFKSSKVAKDNAKED